MKSTKDVYSAVATLALALLLSFTLVIPAAFAADGDLDPAFSGDGLQTTDFQNTADELHDVIIQPDGNIVAVGATQIDGGRKIFSLARYNPSGFLDPSFTGSGYRLLGMGAGDAEANAVAIQSDGKIIAAGYCQTNNTYSTALVRLHPNGAMDNDFFGPRCGAFPAILTGVAVQPDGRILASGYTPFAANDSFSLFRFWPEGALDTTFGNQGRITTSFFGLQSRANDIILQSDGKILVAGTAQVSGTNYDFALARYLPSGFLDTSFNGSGIVTTNFAGGADEANAVSVAPDGKIYAAGGFFSATQSSNFGVARYLPNGSLDTSFSGDGIVDLPIFAGNNADAARDVVIQPADGKVVAAGFAVNSAVTTSALVRFNTSGSPDTTFGNGGKITAGFGSNNSSFSALAVQVDGKLVPGGTTLSAATNSDFALARYLSTVPPTPTPTSTSATPPTATPTATPTACPIEFTDVPQGSTYYDAVHCLACRGVIGGYTSGCPTGNPCFKPDNPLTRGDLAKIISNASGFAETYTTNTFEDVPPSSAYFQFVERVSSRSIMTGFPCGSAGEFCHPPANKPYFRPGFPVTRGEYAKVVATALNLSAPSPLLRSFEDVPMSHPYWRWIEALRRSRLIGGFACGGTGEPCVAPSNRPYFRPNAYITRGDAGLTITLAYFPSCLAHQTNPTK